MHSGWVPKGVGRQGEPSQEGGVVGRPELRGLHPEGELTEGVDARGRVSRAGWDEGSGASWGRGCQVPNKRSWEIRKFIFGVRVPEGAPPQLQGGVRKGRGLGGNNGEGRSQGERSGGVGQRTSRPGGRPEKTSADPKGRPGSARGWAAAGPHEGGARARRRGLELTVSSTSLHPHLRSFRLFSATAVPRPALGPGGRGLNLGRLEEPVSGGSPRALGRTWSGAWGGGWDLGVEPGWGNGDGEEGPREGSRGSVTATAEGRGGGHTVLRGMSCTGPPGGARRAEAGQVPGEAGMEAGTRRRLRGLGEQG